MVHSAKVEKFLQIEELIFSLALIHLSNLFLWWLGRITCILYGPFSTRRRRNWIKWGIQSTSNHFIKFRISYETQFDIGFGYLLSGLDNFFFLKCHKCRSPKSKLRYQVIVSNVIYSVHNMWGLIFLTIFRKLSSIGLIFIQGKCYLIYCM